MDPYLRILQGIVILLLHFGVSTSERLMELEFKDVRCPGLPDKWKDNVLLKCYNRSMKEIDCRMDMHHGSRAIYSCPKYFKPVHGLKEHNENNLACAFGEWKNVKLFRSYTCIPECGTYFPSFGPLPWQVVIKKNYLKDASKSEDDENECTGTLIPSIVGNASAILTYKNCILRNGAVLSSHEISVLIDRPSFSRREKYMVSTIFTHSKSEIVILNLTTPVQLYDEVLPICLQGPSSLSTISSGVVFTKEEAISNKISMTVISRDQCQEAGYIPTDDEFCALKSTSNDTLCPDIVEPIFAENKTTQKFVLIGIGKGSLRVNRCKHYIGVYIKLSGLQNWIHTVQRLISGLPEVQHNDSVIDNDGKNNSHRERMSTVAPREISTPRFYIPGKLTTTSIPTTMNHEIRTSNKNRTITTTVNDTYLSQDIECPTLKETERGGFQIDCTNIMKSLRNSSTSIVQVNCKTSNSAVGTQATYTCRRGFVPSSLNTFSKTKCQMNGQWSQLEETFKCVKDGYEVIRDIFKHSHERYE